VALTLLVLLLPAEELLAALASVPGPVWAIAIPGYLALHVVGSLKWRLMVNAADGGLAFGDAVRCYYYGLFGNTFLPSVVGGDVVRAGLALRLARRADGVVVGSVADRALDVVALAAVAGLGVLLLPSALDPRSRTVFTILLAGLVFGVAVFAAVARGLPVRRLPYRVRRLLAKVRRSVRAVRSRPRRLGQALAMGISLQLLLVLLQAVLGVAVGIDVPLTVWLFAWPMAKLSALLPLTQGGLGVREAALAGLLAPFGVEPVLAVAAGLAFQGVIISGGLVGGGLAFLLARSARDR
jgi:uncharacterized protein (TIRG00374 family)